MINQENCQNCCFWDDLRPLSEWDGHCNYEDLKTQATYWCPHHRKVKLNRQETR